MTHIGLGWLALAFFVVLVLGGGIMATDLPGLWRRTTGRRYRWPVSSD